MFDFVCILLISGYLDTLFFSIISKVYLHKFKPQRPKLNALVTSLARMFPCSSDSLLKS